MESPRVWLITGASSGFGKAATEVLLRKGDAVVATLRKPSALEPLVKQYPPSQLLVLPVDVTCPSDITAAFARTKEAFGKLDVVFNNAGCGMIGEVESIPDTDARALFEVNFWGAVGVSRAAVEFFREVNPPGKGGVLLQNSSMLGFHGRPGSSFYSASKHALDGFSESLSKELLLEWNIKICILQPGVFDTKILAASQYPPLHPAYANSDIVGLRKDHQELSPEGDPYKFAEMLYQLAINAEEGKEIPLFLPVGKDALGRLEDKLKRMSDILQDAVPWSADLTKDNTNSKAAAKL